MFALIIFGLFVLICTFAYYKIQSIASSYVRSNIDGKYYLVRNLPDKQLMADRIAYIRLNILKLIQHMQMTSSEYKDNINTLANKFNNVTISENIFDSNYTSYSVNKGEQLVFCMRSRDHQMKDSMHDINLMMYVVLHEISHIACPEYGHTQKFKDIFKFITQQAISIGIYEPIDFKHIPKEYCGMIISDSII